MISSQATQSIIKKAKEEANSTVGGGIQKKLNDLQSYGTSLGTGGVSFLISHIPIVGPVLAKAFQLSSDIGISKLYEKLLSESHTPAERIGNSLFLLECSLSASIRQAYNTLAAFNQKVMFRLTHECKDCQDAFQEANAAYLAGSCVEDLEAACSILEQLLKDLRSETMNFKNRVNNRIVSLPSAIDDFRDNHPGRVCIGAQACYWKKGPGTPFSSIGDKDL